VHKPTQGYFPDHLRVLTLLIPGQEKAKEEKADQWDLGRQKRHELSSP